jgi:hypothetical protein
MSAKEFVLLIPGYFGFDSFGGTPDSPPVISYFDGVIESMMKAVPGRWQRDQFKVTQPQPTGSLHERVASLHDSIRSLVPISGGARQWQDVRIHLVGHSTGGLDACLYVSPGFHWQGAPDDAERANWLQAIGNVATVSAPLRAAPIAAKADALEYEFLNFLYLVSILGKSTAPSGAAGVLALLERTPFVSELAALGTSVARILSRTHENVVDLAILGALGLDLRTRDEIYRFMRKLTDDRQLHRDLSPGIRWNTQFAQYLAPRRPVFNFATVSPSPSMQIADPIRGLLYRLAYNLALDDAFKPVDWSGEHWIGAMKDTVDHSKCVNDGVVPASSQVLPGARPHAVVEADHADVVGHFEGSPNGVVVFKSGADFGINEFDGFWAAVSAVLRE